MVVSKGMPIHSFPQDLLRIFNSDLLAYPPLAVLSSVFDSLQEMGRNSPEFFGLFFARIGVGTEFRLLRIFPMSAFHLSILLYFLFY